MLEEPKPVAWMHYWPGGSPSHSVSFTVTEQHFDGVETVPVYTHPQLAQTEPLAAVIAEYARDLRRNSSGGDDYPWEVMTGVADALDAILQRYPAQAPTDETVTTIKTRIKLIDDLLHSCQEAHKELHELAHEFEQLIGNNK